jgi:hypothetical protein
MAAGLPGPSGPEGGARDFAWPCGTDQSRRAKPFIFKPFIFKPFIFEPFIFKPFIFRRFIFKRFTSDHFDFRCSRRGAMSIGTAVSTQKHTEIVFEGMESSCYPLPRMGAEGIVAIISRRPN